MIVKKHVRAAASSSLHLSFVGRCQRSRHTGCAVAKIERSRGMNRFLHGVARAVTETFDLPEPILEIGSYQVAGQEEIANLRSLFPGKEYIGIDARPGPGVDVVADVEELPFSDASIGTVDRHEHLRACAPLLARLR